MPKKEEPPEIEAYRDFGNALKSKASKEEANELLCRLVESSYSFLEQAEKSNLTSLVPQKEYFQFIASFPSHTSTDQSRTTTKRTRAINSGLWLDERSKCLELVKAILHLRDNPIDGDTLNSGIYSAVVSFLAVIDLLKTGDQKTPGTFFEYVIRHILECFFEVTAVTRVPVLNMDQEADLPTDLIFDMGKKKPKFHVPVKTSTRERIIQVWAHQRVLDGVYGTGRFLGIPMILTETKTDQKKGEVTEICLPLQWNLYQMHIAQLWSIGYLDVPQKYAELAKQFPIIPVTTFGEFFGAGGKVREWLEIASETSA